jgi:hypothetical protein
MSFTAKLGTADSRPGNIRPGLITSSSLNQTVSDSLTLSQSITTQNTHSQSISQSLTLTQSVVRNYIASISDSLTLSQTLFNYVVHTQTISQPLGLTQIVTTNVDWSRTVTQSLTPTQSIHLTYTKSISDSLTVNQSISGYVTRLVSQSLTVNQSITTQHIHGRSVFDFVSVTQTVGLQSGLTQTINQPLSLVQGINPGYTRNEPIVFHGQPGYRLGDIELAYRSAVYESVVTDTLTFTQTISSVSHLSSRVAHALALTQSIQYNVDRTATPGSTLSFPDAQTVYLNYATPVLIPNIRWEIGNGLLNF